MDHIDDATLVSRFEALAVEPHAFHHREHLRLAFAMLDGAEFGLASTRYRHALRRFADSVGATGKYQETLTRAWLALVAERMAAGHYASSLDLLAAHPDLLDKQAVKNP
jgi:hypothetical protein